MFIASKFAPFNMYMPFGVPVDCVSLWTSKHAGRLKTNQGQFNWNFYKTSVIYKCKLLIQWVENNTFKSFINKINPAVFFCTYHDPIPNTYLPVILYKITYQYEVEKCLFPLARDSHRW